MQRILIIQTAFIGDVVLATSLIEKLHQRFPGSEIDFLLRKGNEALLANHPHLNAVLIWDKTSNKKRNLFKLLFNIRKRKYDLVINVQRFAATGLLTAWSGAKHTIGFDKNPWSRFFSKRVAHVISTAENPVHEIQRNQLLIEEWTDPLPAKPRLYPSQKDISQVIEFKSHPYIIVAPASVWYTKQYPVEKWISFLDKLTHSLHVYIIGAPGDRPLGDKIKSGTSHPHVSNLCGQFSFLQSAALQQDAQMNFVNDSAPMHFASAMNAPVTAIYCSTLPSFGFGPLSDRQAIVEIEEPLPCRPCGLHGRPACPLGHFNCAFKIRDEQLLQVLQS